MPNLDGLETLEKKIQTLNPDLPVIMISGANIDTAAVAVKPSCVDFISKPPDLNRMLITIRNAMDKFPHRREKKYCNTK